MGWKACLTQLICRDGLSSPTFRALQASMGDLKKGNCLGQQFKKRMIERKTEILIQGLPQANRGAMVLWIICVSVIQFLISFPFPLYYYF